MFVLFNANKYKYPFSMLFDKGDKMLDEGDKKPVGYAWVQPTGLKIPLCTEIQLKLEF